MQGHSSGSTHACLIKNWANDWARLPYLDCSSAFCFPLRVIWCHIGKLAQLYFTCGLLKSTVRLFRWMLCFFFLPLTFDLCCRHKIRTCNDHHCFIWLLPWQPLLISPVAHALPYRFSKPTKSGFHGYSFRAPLWLHSWKCWLSLVSVIPAWVNVWTHVILLLLRYIVLAIQIMGLIPRECMGKICNFNAKVALDKLFCQMHKWKYRNAKMRHRKMKV